jgi:S-adenosylmethionine-diacylglycerol 3-amino-3-carboxypropyl transferase
MHQHNLIYNTCWEDPRIDREALELTEQDSVLVITSAGCNALDYALESPKHVYAVDINPLQNSLLELKLACIRRLEFAEFFQLFGKGYHPHWAKIYHDRVRAALAPQHRETWDRRIGLLDGTSRRKSFYFRGTSGLFAWLINGYLNRPPGLREAVHQILEASSLEEQEAIYDMANINQLLWRKPLRWFMRRDTTLALLGVPRSQRNQIDTCYPGGIEQFIQDRIERVFKRIPLSDNYFWRVYLTGSYTPECCPEYLKRDNFHRLKDGLSDRISTHDTTVQQFLAEHPDHVSRFVLLDHMDWLYDRHPELLRQEWQSILDRAAPDSRVLWRSAALQVNFVDPLRVVMNGKSIEVGELLRYHPELASNLHARDRVQTYGSFYIADVAKAA